MHHICIIAMHSIAREIQLVKRTQVCGSSTPAFATAPRSPEIQRRWSTLLTLFCYHVATRTGQTGPILPHVGGVLLCGFLLG